MAREAGWDHTITVFSPEGRLYQIEYAFKAAKSTGLTSVAVRGDDSVVFVAQKRVSDKLIDASSVTHLYKITEKICAVATGLIPDTRALVRKAREIAAEFEFDNGYAIPVAHLAKKLADENQIYTQHAYKRSFAVVLMLGAVDDEKGPQLFRVDPAGHFLGYKASAAGVKEQEAVNLLENHFKSDAGAAGAMSADETIRAAITTMQGILTSDFKAAEIEMSIVKGDERVRYLTEAEIDAHLTAIAERE